MTCNSNWDKIHELLLPGQKPQDRPDIVTRVFCAKCEQLKEDLFRHHVLGKVLAHVHVIEFQKRGLLHAHFLLIFQAADKLRNPEDYDRIVRAYIPDPLMEPELHAIVIRHMIHGPCGLLNRDSVCMKDRMCKKNYPKQTSEVTLQGNDSFPIYKRPRNGPDVIRNGVSVDNTWVVPYNAWLLKKYDCHLNVEIFSTITSAKYLYKYVYKGSDRVRMEVSSDVSHDHDEIRQFVDARWICPHEALWKIFMLPLNCMYPFEYQLQELPEHYKWDRVHRQWQRMTGHKKVVGKLCSVSPSEGERYYLRVLLTHVRSPVFFDDLKTVNGNFCSTFKDAAVAMGKLETDESIRDTLLKACSVGMPSSLRKMFALILVYCDPLRVRDLWTEFCPHMSEDYSRDLSDDERIYRLLREIGSTLEDLGKKLSDFDLPLLPANPPSSVPTIITEERSVPIPLEDVAAVEMLNTDQRHAYRQIMDSVDVGLSAFYFIDDPGGSGKMFSYRSILASIRSSDHIALATSTSGIAAIMMPGGRTAHSRFKIPIPTLPTSTCNISKQSDLVKLLNEASLIIWDEATMTHRCAFEALDRTLKDLFENDLPFGGKVIVLGGDFRQVLPVVPRGSCTDVINACITRSPIWQHVLLIHLRVNIRARMDPTFSEHLLHIGNGTYPTVVDDMIRLPDEIVVPWDNERSLDQLIHCVFPSVTSNAHDRDFIMERALVTPRNRHVDMLNDKVIQLFPATLGCYAAFYNVTSSIYMKTHLLASPLRFYFFLGL